jgi:hypothetical protein
VDTVYVVGDLHGCYVQAVDLLQKSQLIDADLTWSARDATVCFVGDYVDHGPDGIGCIDLVMRLQREAALAGGQVIALLGNHEPMLLAAHRFGDQLNPLLGQTFADQWREKNGMPRDLAQLTPAHVAWLARLPAMSLVADRLLIHADALFYTRYGHTVADVNRVIRTLLEGDDPAAWAQLIEQFSEHHAFRDDEGGNRESARHLRHTFGGRQIIHGHTPLCKVLNQPMTEITQPLVYADGLCVNVDHGLYLDGPGFVYQLTR